MTFKVTISTEIPEFWDDDLLKHNSSTAYQLSVWGKIYQKSYNSIPFFIQVTRNGELLSQLMVLLHNDYLWKNVNFLSNVIGNKLKIKNSLGWIYGPIIHDSENHKEIMELLLNSIDTIAKENNVNYIRGTIPPNFDPSTESIFKKSGYSSTPWTTHIINLKQDEKSIYSQLDKKTRYDIRKSEKNKLKFEIGDNFNSLLAFDKMKKNSKNIITDNTNLQKNRWDYLYNTSNGKLFLAKLENNYIGSISSLTFNKNIVQHGVTNIKQNLLGGTFLTWNLIKWGIKNNFNTLDLGGINPNPQNNKEKQISFYKSKWGGKNLKYNIYTKIFDNTRHKISTILQNPNKVKNFLKSN